MGSGQVEGDKNGELKRIKIGDNGVDEVEKRGGGRENEGGKERDK